MAAFAMVALLLLAAYLVFNRGAGSIRVARFLGGE